MSFSAQGTQCLRGEGPKRRRWTRPQAFRRESILRGDRIRVQVRGHSDFFTVSVYIARKSVTALRCLTLCLGYFDDKNLFPGPRHPRHSTPRRRPTTRSTTRWRSTTSPWWDLPRTTTSLGDKKLIQNLPICIFSPAKDKITKILSENLEHAMPKVKKSKHKTCSQCEVVW